MTEYTQEEKLAHDFLHLSVVAINLKMSKEDFMEAASYAYDHTDLVPDKDSFALFLKKTEFQKGIE